MRWYGWMPKYSLRNLLFVVLLVACACAVWRYRLRHWEYEAAKMNGRWQGVSWDTGDPPAAFVEIHDREVKWISANGQTTTLVASMPIMAVAGQIDLTRPDGVVIPAIFKVEGNTLTIIHASSNTRRPSDFERNNTIELDVKISLRRTALR